MAKSKSVPGLAIIESERWKVERDLEYLMEADKIKEDPKRLAKVQALAKQKMMEAAKVATDID